MIFFTPGRGKKINILLLDSVYSELWFVKWRPFGYCFLWMSKPSFRVFFFLFFGFFKSEQIKLGYMQIRSEVCHSTRHILGTSLSWEFVWNSEFFIIFILLELLCAKHNFEHGICRWLDGVAEWLRHVLHTQVETETAVWNPRFGHYLFPLLSESRGGWHSVYRPLDSFGA